MTRVAVEIDLRALERAVEHLPEPVKIRLARRWERAASADEWSRLFAAMDRRRRGRRFTMADIVREVKAYRREQPRG